MYCTPEDLRREGVTEGQATDDERLCALCALSGTYIETMTKQFFEPRVKICKLDGNGGETLLLPFFLIEPEHVKCGGYLLDEQEYVLYNRITPEDDRNYPRIKRRGGWPKSDLNIEIKGLWGYVDEAPDGGYMTPPLIRKAAIRLTVMQLPLLGDEMSQEEKMRRNILVSETTDGHSYTLDRSVAQSIAERAFTGDSEIDQILSRYSTCRVGLGLI